MEDELRRFYSQKEKDGINGKEYGYDADGNLIRRDNKGTVIKTITLPTYRRPTEEEIDVMEQQRKEAIAVAESVFDDARSALYEMSQNPERDDSTMLRLNRAVVEAESKLITTRFPLVHIDYVANIPFKQVDFTQPNNDRKVPYLMAILETRPFRLQEQYVRIGEAPKRPMVSVAEAKERLKEAEKAPVIVFEGTESDDYGYLSLDWAVMIDFNSTMYHSAKQAVYAELAKFFNDEINLPQLLAAKTADEIDYSVEDIPGENNKDKWNEQIRKLMYDINLVKFKQYPELAAKLLETKNAILGAYLPGDMLLGIGISIESLDAKDPSKWSENVLGKALMNIRDVLKHNLPVAPASIQEPSIRKKSRGKPSVGKFPVTTSASQDTSVTGTQIKIPSIAVADVPLEEAPLVNATRRTLRMGGRNKVASSS